MTIYTQIVEDFTTARKNRDLKLANVLGNIKTKLLIIEKKEKTVTDAQSVKVIKDELIALNSTINFVGIKEELKNNALVEKVILEKYLPALVDDEIVEKALVEGIENGTVEKNLGSVMRFLKTNFDGRFDMSKGKDLFAKYQ